MIKNEPNPLALTGCNSACVDILPEKANFNHFQKWSLR